MSDGHIFGLIPPMSSEFSDFSGFIFRTRHNVETHYSLFSFKNMSPEHKEIDTNSN